MIRGTILFLLLPLQNTYIKEQTRKLLTDRLKHYFELADKADQVRNIYLGQGNANVGCFLIFEEYKVHR